MPFAPLRGFRDYLPPDAGARSEIRRRMREAARLAGFQELETPSVEALDLFKVKSGEAIGEETWSFRDKGDREVALVSETTPSVARVFVDRAKSEPLPVKWFTVSKLWRYEEPQAGRTREFLQFNLDILGVPGVEAETELLATAALLLDRVGAQGTYAFRVNDRRLAAALGSYFGATDTERYFRALDRSPKETPEWLDRELRAAGLDDAAVRKLTDLLGRTRSGVAADALPAFLDELGALGLPGEGERARAELRRFFELLKVVGIDDRVRFDPTIVRGLAYYTGIVFEAFDVRGERRSLFGGGRYDRLVELFGGPPTPAAGLAVGDQTLELLLRDHGRWPEGEPALDTYVVAITPEEVPRALAMVAKLRAAGVPADCDPMARSLSRQLREAARRRARRAILLGPKERARGVVVERDLATGAQRELAPEAVLPGA
jgi:histidyl-tRNA synthetase